MRKSILISSLVLALVALVVGASMLHQ
jgi:hypothetical protein